MNYIKSLKTVKCYYFFDAIIFTHISFNNICSLNTKTSYLYEKLGYLL